MIKLLYTAKVNSLAQGLISNLTQRKSATQIPLGELFGNSKKSVHRQGHLVGRLAVQVKLG